MDILCEQSPSSIQLALAVNLVALLCTAPYFFHMVVKMEPSEGVVSAQGWANKWGPRLRELLRQVEAEVVSNSSGKNCTKTEDHF